MSYEDFEYSVQDGAPIELFSFISDGGGLEYYYTNNDTEISFGGKIYEPIHIRRAAISVSAVTAQPATIDFELDRNSDLGELYSLPHAPPTLFVRVWRTHEGSTDYRKMFLGRSHNFMPNEETIVVQTKPYIEGLIHRTLPANTLNGRCNHTFLDARCGLNRADFTWNTSVVSINGQYVTVGNDFNDNGALKFGDLIINGEYRFILDNVNNVIKVRYPFTIASPGDAAELVMGCRKTKPACDEFNNYARFGGNNLTPMINPTKTPIKPSPLVSFPPMPPRRQSREY